MSEEKKEEKVTKKAKKKVAKKKEAPKSKGKWIGRNPHTGEDVFES